MDLQSRQKEYDTRPDCWLNDFAINLYRQNGMKIGNRCFIDRTVSLDRHQPHMISLGDDVVLTGQGVYLTHDASPQMLGLPGETGHIRIGNRVFVGYRCLMLCGTSIGDDCIIGAGSVITKDIPAGEVWAGNPAKRVCSIEEYRAKHALKSNDK